MGWKATLPIALLIFSCVESFQFPGWKLKQLFTYRIEGRTVTGLPQLREQYSGIAYYGNLLIETHTQNTLLMKFSDMKFSKLDGDLPDGWWSESSAAYYNETETLEMTKSTFIVQLENNFVKQVVVPKDLPTWQLNFIKGFVKSFSAYGNQKERINKKTNNKISHSKTDSVFHIMEETVVGRCEVQYEISKISKANEGLNKAWNHPMAKSICPKGNIFEITKTYDYNNCEHISETHFAFPENGDCMPGSNSCGNFMKRSSINRITACANGSSFILLDSITTSSINANLQLHDESKAVINSKLNISLIDHSPAADPKSTDSLRATLMKIPQHINYFSYVKSDTIEKPSLLYCNNGNNNNSNNKNDDSNTNKNKQGGKNHRSKTPNDGNNSKTHPKSSILNDNHNDNDEDSQNNGANKRSADDPPSQPFNPFVMSYSEGRISECIVDMFEMKILEIANDIFEKRVLPEDGLSEKITDAVEICQMLSFQQMESVSDHILNNSNVTESTQNARSVFMDVVTICGTKPSLRMIATWFKDNKIGSEKAADILTRLPDKLMSGDKETVELYFEMVKRITENSSSDSQTSISAVLGFSNFVRVACVNKKSMVSRFNPKLESNLCKESDVNHYIQWMELMSSKYRTYVAAIGNTGSKSVIPTLMSFAENSDLSNYRRVAAIVSMKYLAINYPKDTATGLFELYRNPSTPTACRITAFSMLVYSKPPLSMWQRIAVSTWYEQNSVVSHFVQTTINSLFQTKSNLYHEIAKSASIVRPLMKPVEDTKLKSFNGMKESEFGDIQTVIFEQSSWMGLSDVMSMYHRQLVQTNDFSSLYEAELMTANPDGLITAIRDLLMLNKDVTRSRPPIPNLKRSTRLIHDLLGLVERKPPQLEGDLHIRFNKLIEKIYPFNRKTQVSIVKWGRLLLTQTLVGGLKFNHQRIDMTSNRLSTTTELGFPVRLLLQVPSLFQASGKIKIVQNDAVDTSLAFLYSSGMNTDLSFYTPWNDISYSAGIRGSCFAQLPNLKMRLQYENSQFLHIKTDPIEKSKLIHHSTVPFTGQEKTSEATRTLFSKNGIKVVHSGETKERSVDLYPEVNVLYRTEGEVATTEEFLNTLSLMNNPMMLHRNIIHNQLEITMDELSPMAFDIGLGMALKRNGNIEIDVDYSKYENDNRTSEANTNSTGSVSQNDVLSNETQSTANIANDDSNNTDSTTSIIESLTTPSTESSESSAESDSTTSKEEDPPSKGFFSSVKNFFHRIFGSESKENVEITRRKVYERSTHQNSSDEDLRLHSVSYSIDGNSFNASLLDPFTNGEGREAYEFALIKILNGISSGESKVLSFNVTVEKPDAHEQYRTLIAYGSSSMNHIRRIGVFFQGNETSSKGGFTSTLEVPVLPAFDLETIMIEKAQQKLYVDFAQERSGKRRTLAVQGDMTYKASQLSSWNSIADMEISSTINECQKPRSIVSKECRRGYDFGTSIGKYSFNVDTNDESGSIQWFMNKIINNAIYAGKKYITEYDFLDHEESIGKGKAQLDVVVNKENTRFNARMKTQRTEIVFERVPLKLSNSLMWTLLKEIQQQNSEYCGITDTQITTFDKVKVNYTMNNCWHLAVKDCSGKSRVAILTKKSQNIPNLDIEVNLDNYQVISIIDGAIDINEKKNITVTKEATGVMVSDEAGSTLVEMEQTLDYGLFISLPAHGFSIIYSNTSAVIYASSKMQNRLCGLCGDYNMEKFGELSMPNGSRAHSTQEFGNSYALKDESC